VRLEGGGRREGGFFKARFALGRRLIDLKRRGIHSLGGGDKEEKSDLETCGGLFCEMKKKQRAVGLHSKGGSPRKEKILQWLCRLVNL